MSSLGSQDMGWAGNDIVVGVGVVRSTLRRG